MRKLISLLYNNLSRLTIDNFKDVIYKCTNSTKLDRYVVYNHLNFFYYNNKILLGLSSMVNINDTPPMFDILITLILPIYFVFSAVHVIKEI